MYATPEEIEEAIKIVGPVAAACGVTDEELRATINWVDHLAAAGIRGKEAGLALRKLLSQKR